MSKFTLKFWDFFNEIAIVLCQRDPEKGVAATWGGSRQNFFYQKLAAKKTALKQKKKKKKKKKTVLKERFGDGEKVLIREISENNAPRDIINKNKNLIC